MEITIKISRQAVSVEVSYEVYVKCYNKLVTVVTNKI